GRDDLARRPLVPVRAAAPRAPGGPRRPPLPVLPRPPASAFMPASRYRSRPCRSAPPGDLQPVDAAIQPPVCLPGGAGGKARDRGLRAHEARRRRVAGGARGKDPRRSQRRRRAVRTRRARRGGGRPFAPDGPAEEGDYVLAVGTVEPRKNLTRLAESTRRLGVELRIVGAPGWGHVELGAGVRRLGRVGDDELARHYRGARCVAYPSL